METWDKGDIVEYVEKHIGMGGRLIVEVTGPRTGTSFPGIVISDTRPNGNKTGLISSSWHAPAFTLKTIPVTADTVIEQLEQLERKYHD